jgi:uncharacterized protein YbjT (DUF2867 family)
VIIVTGATGLTGTEVVRRLSARGVPVRALVRNAVTTNAAKAGALSELPGVEVVEGDMGRPETLGPALEGVDRAMLISSSAADMATVQNAFVDAAAAAGVAHVVKLSGIMPEIDSPFRFARMHGEVEQHIQRSGVAWTHLRAGEFMHAYFRQVPSIVNRGVLGLPMADARIASIDIGDIAEVAVDVLTGAGHEGRIYPITGPESLTMAEVAERLSAVTGKEVRYVAVAPEEARAIQLANGVPEYTADGLFELFAERRQGKEATAWPTIREVFGREPVSFAEFARRNAAIFRGEAPAPRV